jgi:hypothetical protein
MMAILSGERSGKPRAMQKHGWVCLVVPVTPPFQVQDNKTEPGTARFKKENKL